MSGDVTSSPVLEKETMFVDSGCARLFTVLWPRRNAETVLLLHGGPGVPMDFSAIAEQLSRNYQVVAFDQRGTGRSPAKGATYSMEEYVEDIDAITAHFALSEFHLFGHSWGALYAQIYAERNPQRILSMFLCSPSSGTGQVWKRTEREVMSFNKEHSGAWGWSIMGVKSLLGILGSDKAYQSLFKQVLENYNKEFDSAFTATDAMVENVRAEPINKTRPHIVSCPPLKDSPDPGFPVMITYGQKDIYGDSKRSVRNRFPKTRFVEFENAGHIAWRHNKEQFNKALTEFFRIK